MKKKILIIDDSPLVNIFFEKLVFKEFTFEYKQTLDPFKTQENIEEYDPDLIILDVNFNLPIDGLEIGMFINSNYEIPIIYYSSVELLEAKEIIDQVVPYAFFPKSISNKNDIQILIYSLIKRMWRDEEDNSNREFASNKKDD